LAKFNLSVSLVVRWLQTHNSERDALFKTEVPLKSNRSAQPTHWRHNMNWW